MPIPTLLRENARFRRFWAGQAVSLVGDQVSLIALPLVAVLALDASAAQMGYLVAAELAPNLVFSLHAGAWVDRRGRRRETMIATDLARAGLIGSLPIAYAFDALTFPHMVLVAFLVGTMAVLFHVSYGQLFVSLVPREQYVQGGSIMHGTRAFSFVLGPTAGGVLVQVLTAPVTLVVDACSYLVSALFLRTIRAVEPETEKPGEGHVVAGVRYATKSLGVEPATLGLVLGAGAVGGVIGSLVTGRVSRRMGLGPAFALGCLLFPLPLVLVPLAGGPEPVVLTCLFLAEFGSGLGVMMLDISASAIFLAIVPHRMLARFSGAYMVVNYGVRPLGALAGGALGSWIGLRPTLWVATVGALLGVLWLLPSPILGLRTLPEAEEAAG